jgi:CRP-like cAMP-binding protein
MPAFPLTQDPIPTLRELELFQGLSEVEIAVLISACAPVHLRAGEVLLQQGELAEDLFVLLSGQLRVLMRRQDGEDQEITVLQPGGVVGERALSQQESARSASVVALEDVELLRLARADLDALADRQPRLVVSILQNFIRIQTQRLERMTQMFAHARTALSKLAAL